MVNFRCSVLTIFGRALGFLGGLERVGEGGRRAGSKGFTTKAKSNNQNPETTPLFEPTKPKKRTSKNVKLKNINQQKSTMSPWSFF